MNMDTRSKTLVAIAIVIIIGTVFWYMYNGGPAVQKITRPTRASSTVIKYTLTYKQPTNVATGTYDKTKKVDLFMQDIQSRGTSTKK